MVSFDLDAKNDFDPHDSPIVGQAQCSSLAGAKQYTWGAKCGGVENIGINSNGAKEWCPQGTFLVAFDLDGSPELGSAYDTPVIGAAKCSGPISAIPPTSNFGDLEAKDWCYKISVAEDTVIFFPIIKNVGIQDWASTKPGKYFIGAGYNGHYTERQNISLPAWPDFSIKRGESKMLTKGVHLPRLDPDKDGLNYYDIRNLWNFEHTEDINKNNNENKNDGKLPDGKLIGLFGAKELLLQGGRIYGKRCSN